MIDPVYRREPVVALLRASFRANALAGTIVPSLVDAATATALRADASAAGLTRYEFAPRGRFDHNDLYRPAALLDPLAALVATITGEPVSAAAVRWLRLRHGDYSLLWDDHLTRPAQRHFEATLDLSSSTTGQGGTIYVANGEARFVAPQRHGCLAIVDRPPHVLRYERYLDHRVGAAEVWRLRVTFVPAAPPAA